MVRNQGQRRSAGRESRPLRSNVRKAHDSGFYPGPACKRIVRVTAGVGDDTSQGLRMTRSRPIVALAGAPLEPRQTRN